jgi:fatty acid desaturase
MPRFDPPRGPALGARPMPALAWALIAVKATIFGVWIAVLDGKPLAGVVAGLVAALLLRRLWQAHVMIVMTLPAPQVPARRLANRQRRDRRGRRPLRRW